MRRLRTDADLEDLAKRLRTLTPDSPRKWGRMSCGQMVCHLADAFRGTLSDRPPSAPRVTWLSRSVVRRLALSTPVPWPSGTPTSPEIDQVAGAGTPPRILTDDVQSLIELMRRFLVLRPNQRRPHPAFGQLTSSEWARWGWAHVDHHLRQFGA
jgi:hypothetical protein